MENWRQLIHVLVEIWTDEDIKSEKWGQSFEDIEVKYESNEECISESQQNKRCA